MTARDPSLRTTLVDAIIALTADFGYPSTQAELAIEMKRSRSFVQKLLLELRAAKVVEWDRSARSVRVVRMSE